MIKDFTWLTSAILASSLLIFSNTAHAASAVEVMEPYTNFPYRTIGKLEAKFPKLGKFVKVCTASSIGNQAIWTAGHCVYDTDLGGWATKVTFTPAYKGGSKPPYGVWDASDIYTTKTWQSGGKLFGSRRDIAGAILRLNDNGKKISYVVGWLGFHWGDPYPREQYYHFLGYPAKPSPPFPSDGSRMFSCEGQGGSTAFPRPFISGDGPDMQTIPCDMGEGASGAPWITDFSPTPGQTDFLHGNGALLNPLYSGEVLSPYFDATAGDLWGCLLEGTKCSNFTHQSLGLIAGGGK